MRDAGHHRWSDGTTHLVFEPMELLERLAALTPRPRINLILYYGVLGAPAAWRRRIVPSAATADASASAGPRARAGGNYLWAELMQRTFGVDVLNWTAGLSRLVPAS